VGPWLPSPIETGDGDEADAADPALPTDARYDLRESASFAFLRALEALTPQQRAVLVLRDVLDYSVREAADTLSLSEANVKTTHHRARRVMEGYDAARPTRATAEATRAALERFMAAVLSEDVAAVEACLADDAEAVSDGGGEFLAALKPVLGPNRIARFLLGIQRKSTSGGRFAVRGVNGLPALVAEVDTKEERWAPRYVLRCEADASGRIREVHIVAATAKLTAIGPVG
jgi:RNA polymerase sigma-70 factor (ECF subfamily)